MIPYGRQSINQADITAVVEVMKSDWLTQGPIVPTFERAVADKFGASHSIALNSATSALHLACLALDLGPGDWLWTSPNTFVASANCAIYCGAKVDFVDIDPLTYNMSVEALQIKLKQAELLGKLPKIVIPVHFAGQSCDMEAIHELSSQYGFKIIEDASHAIGGYYKNKPIGQCVYSDITIFSFHPVKIITTGEGGMALTNSLDLAERMQMLRSHGITRDGAKLQSKLDGPWYYEQLELGFNYRLTDIQAGLGLSQLERLDPFISKRRQLAATYDEALAHLPLILPFQHEDTLSAFHLYVIQTDTVTSPLDRKALYEYLLKSGVGVNVHYIPVHTQPYYRRMSFQPGQFLEAERYYANAITLPLYFGLEEDQQLKVIEILSTALRC